MVDLTSGGHGVVAYWRPATNTNRTHSGSLKMRLMSGLCHSPEHYEWGLISVSKSLGDVGDEAFGTLKPTGESAVLETNTVSGRTTNSSGQPHRFRR